MNLLEYYSKKGLGEEYKLWQMYVHLRQIHSFEELPVGSQERIKKALKLVLSRFNDTPVYLTGSYVNGCYRDHTTPKNIIDAYSKMYNKRRIYSDIDLWVPNNKERIKISYNCEIIPEYRTGKILLHDI